MKPEDATPFLERGFSYGQLGEFPRAVEDCDRALQRDPKNLRALTLRLLAEGVTAPQVAQTVPLTPKAIRQIAHRYNSNGLDRSLYDKPRQGAQQILDDSQKQQHHRHGLQSTARRAGSLDCPLDRRRGLQTQTGRGCETRDNPDLAAKPRVEAVAGKKCGGWRSWTRNTSKRWRMC